MGHSAADYAETLLGLVAQADPPLALAALRRRSGLAGRIQHILSQAVPHPRLGRAWAIAVFMVAATSIGVTAICQRGVARADAPQASKPATDEDKKPAVDSKTAFASGTDDTNPKPAPIAASNSSEAMPGKDRSPGDESHAAAGLVDEETDNSQPQHWKTSGRVIASDGKPIANADVYWDVFERPGVDGTEWPDPQTRGRAKTDVDGQFTIEADFSKQRLGSQNLVVRAAGFGVRSNSTTDLTNLTKPVEIRMEPSYPLAGTVFSPNGEPVAGARVRVGNLSRWSGPDAKPDEHNSWYFSLRHGEAQLDHPREYWPVPTVTDEKGQFVLDDDVQQTATVEVTIDADDFALTPVTVAGPDSPRNPEIVYREPGFTLVLENPYVVHGRFLDEKTGEPIRGVRVEVEPGAYGRARFTRQITATASDNEGRYVLRLGSADYYSTRVSPPAPYPGVRTSFNARDIALLAGSDRKFDYQVKLRPGLMLTGRVVDAETGEGVPGEQVHYRLLRGRNIGINNRFEPVTTDATGAFEITAVDGKGFLLVDVPGKGFYRLAIRDKRVEDYRAGIYPHGFLEVDIPSDGQAGPTVISLNRGPGLVIRPLSPDGNPVKQVRGAYEEYTLDGFFSANGTPESVFRIDAVEPGRKYQVFLSSEDAKAGTVVEVEAQADGKPIDVVLEPWATIRGRYVYDGGAQRRKSPTLLDSNWCQVKGLTTTASIFLTTTISQDMCTRAQHRCRRQIRTRWHDSGSTHISGLEQRIRQRQAHVRSRHSQARRSPGRGRTGHPREVNDPMANDRWPRDPAEAWLAYEPSEQDPWDLTKVLRMHRRAGFGATWAQAQRDLTDGYEAAVARMLAGAPSGPTDAPALRSKHSAMRWPFRIAATPTHSTRSAPPGSIA